MGDYAEKVGHMMANMRTPNKQASPNVLHVLCIFFGISMHVVSTAKNWSRDVGREGTNGPGFALRSEVKFWCGI